MHTSPSWVIRQPVSLRPAQQWRTKRTCAMASTTDIVSSFSTAWAKTQYLPVPGARHMVTEGYGNQGAKTQYLPVPPKNRGM